MVCRGAFDPQKKAEGTGLVQPGEEVALGRPTPAPLYLQGGCLKGGARLFAEVKR